MTKIVVLTTKDATFIPQWWTALDESVAHFGPEMSSVVVWRDGDAEKQAYRDLALKIRDSMPKAQESRRLRFFLDCDTEYIVGDTDCGKTVRYVL